MRHEERFSKEVEMTMGRATVMESAVFCWEASALESSWEAAAWLSWHALRYQGSHSSSKGVISGMMMLWASSGLAGSTALGSCQSATRPTSGWNSARKEA